MSSLQLDYPQTESEYIYGYATGNRCWMVNPATKQLACACSGKPYFLMAAAGGNTCSTCQGICNRTRAQSTVRPPKPPKNRQFNCGLTPSLCLANNPLARSCGVRTQTNGSCVCNCISKTTGKSMIPGVRVAGSRDTPQTTSTGGMKPGVVYPRPADYDPVVRRVEGMPEGPVKDVLRSVVESIQGVFAWLGSLPNIWGQPMGLTTSLPAYTALLQRWYKNTFVGTPWSQKAAEQVINTCQPCRRLFEAAKSEQNLPDEYLDSLTRQCNACASKYGVF